MPRTDREKLAVPLQPSRDTTYRKGGSQYDTSPKRKLGGVPVKSNVYNPSPTGGPVNKKQVKTVKAFEPPEYIKGIKHIVEGFSGVKQAELGEYVGTSGSHRIDTTYRKGGSQYDYSDESFTRSPMNYIDPETGHRYKKNKGYNRNQKQQYETLVADFQRRMKLRENIVSLPDSEAMQLDEQRKASRRRMRGYSGTLLSQNQKNQGGTLG